MTPTRPHAPPPPPPVGSPPWIALAIARGLLCAVAGLALFAGMFLLIGHAGSLP